VVGDGNRSVDTPVTLPGEQLAIAVDAPTHFMASRGSSCGSLTASSRLRAYVLRQWGLQALSVPVVDLQQQCLRLGAFQQHLEACLRWAGVPLASNPLLSIEVD
jgi:hypothetical protein